MTYGGKKTKQHKTKTKKNMPSCEPLQQTLLNVI